MTSLRSKSGLKESDASDVGAPVEVEERTSKEKQRSAARWLTRALGAMLKRRGTVGAFASSVKHVQAAKLRPLSAVNEGKKEVSAAERLEIAKASLHELMDQAAEKLGEEAPPSHPEGEMEDAIRRSFETLSRGAIDLLTNMSDGYQAMTRDQLKAQATALEMKLAHSRTATSMQLANQAAEMQATFERQLEEKMQEKSGDSALREAEEKLEEANRQISSLKMKFGGIEDAFSKATRALKASEAKASELEEDNERLKESAIEGQKEASECREMLDKAMAELKVKTQKNNSLQEKLQAFITENQQRRVDDEQKLAEMEKNNAQGQQEADECKQQLAAALEELDIKVNENQTLQERLRTFIDEHNQKMAEMEGMRSEAEEVGRQRDEALAAHAKEVEDRAKDVEDLTQQRDVLKLERDELTAQVAALREDLRKGAEQAQADIAKLEAELAQTRETFRAEVSALQNELATTQDDLSTTRAELAVAEEKLAEAANARAVIEQLESALQERKQEIGRMMAEKEDLLAEKQDLMKQHASHVSDLEAGIKDLEARLNESTAKSGKEINDLKVSLSSAEDRADDLEKQLANARAELASVNKVLEEVMRAGDGQNSRIEYWKSMADKAANRAAELEREVSNCKNMLESTLSNLKIKTQKNLTLLEQLREFMLMHEACRMRVASAVFPSLDPKGGVTEQSEKSLADLLTILMDRMNGTNTELEQCKQQVLKALNPTAAANGATFHSDRALGALQTTLNDRYLATQYSLDRVEKQLSIMTDSVIELRLQLQIVTEDGREQLQEAESAAKAERTRLAKAAMTSLQQLRSHLTSTLNGLREEQQSLGGPDEIFIHSPLKGRWGVQTNGKFDELVIRVEAGASSSPNQQRRLRKHQPHSPRPTLEEQSGIGGHVCRTTPPVSEAAASTSPKLPRLVQLNPTLDPAAAHESRSESPGSPRPPRAAKLGGLHGSALSQAMAASRRVEVDDANLKPWMNSPHSPANSPRRLRHAGPLA